MSNSEYQLRIGLIVNISNPKSLHLKRLHYVNTLLEFVKLLLIKFQLYSYFESFEF